LLTHKYKGVCYSLHLIFDKDKLFKVKVKYS
jgi:hypothetical protein